VIAVVAVIAIGIFVVYPYLTNNDFDHEGKHVTAAADTLQPGPASFPGEGWWTLGAETGYALTTNAADAPTYLNGDISSYSVRTYALSKTAADAGSYAEVRIIVYDTVEDAKSDYAELFGGTAPASNSSIFEKCNGAKAGSVTQYRFQDMNVLGHIFFHGDMTQAQIDKVLSEIEKKIHDAAVKI
jgi:alkanesulfonate monooxygenase SsuD/methylene tetrahydromethanopterin reductase-like flavin-dependent oxidoreductase (luciferase family)